MTTRHAFSVGMVGTGAMVEDSHMRGYTQSEHIEFAGFADPARPFRKEIKKLLPSARGYMTYEAMSAEKRIDVTGIYTPAATV